MKTLACALLALIQLSATARAHEGSVSVYNGSGRNPAGFHCKGDLGLGQVWISTVGEQHVAQPGIQPGLESLVFVGQGGAAQPGLQLAGLFQGELLCLPPFVRLSYSPTGLHRIPIPADPALIGPVFCAQAAAIRRDPVTGLVLELELQNALLLQFLGDHCHGEWDCGG